MNTPIETLPAPASDEPVKQKAPLNSGASLNDLINPDYSITKFCDTVLTTTFLSVVTIRYSMLPLLMFTLSRKE
jgi:hypothetical protein